MYFFGFRIHEDSLNSQRFVDSAKIRGLVNLGFQFCKRFLKFEYFLQDSRICDEKVGFVVALLLFSGYNWKHSLQAKKILNSRGFRERFVEFLTDPFAGYLVESSKIRECWTPLQFTYITKPSFAPLFWACHLLKKFVTQNIDRLAKFLQAV